MDCGFCSTGQQGFNRNLDTAEIVGQVWLANRELGYSPDGDRVITNVVFMGMGEPLANYRNVVPAAEVMMDDLGLDLSRRRVTISTSGLVPQMIRIADETNVALAVSLHAPNDELRSEIVPINRKHPIAELLAACWHYVEKQNARNVTFEYVMLDGVNDRPEHARQLAGLLRGHPAKVNLIPFNPFPNTQFRRSSEMAIERFRDILLKGGVMATIRRTRGDDIDAACGQLVGRVNDRVTNRLGQKTFPDRRGAGMRRLVRAALVLLAARGAGACPRHSPTIPTAASRRRRPPRSTRSSRSLTCARTTCRRRARKSRRPCSRIPKTADTQMAAGFIYDRLGETKKASGHYEQAAKLAKNNPGRAAQRGGASVPHAATTSAARSTCWKSAASPLYRTPAVAYTNAGRCARADGRPAGCRTAFPQGVEP